jgi:hypothetical protein
VDHGVDPADSVRLIRHATSLVGAGEIADHHARRSASQVGHTVRTRRVPRVHHHLVPVIEKVSRRRPT